MECSHTDDRLLVVAADDFGRSHSVNQAVAEAHDRGILTAASIMAGGEAFQEAVYIARDRPRLSVGIHVTLCDGYSVLPHSRIPDLTGPDHQMEKSPSAAWLRFSRRGLLSQIDAEVEAQFDLIEKAGIRPTHINSHHHLHMHPLVFEVVCRHALKRGIGFIRFPAEPLPIIFRFRSHARGIMPFIEWAVFGMIGIYNVRTARRYGLCPSCHVYGLSRTEDIDENYLLEILSRFGSPLNEIFLHPDSETEHGSRELGALTSPAVRHRLDSFGIKLFGYGELHDPAALHCAAREKA